MPAARLGGPVQGARRSHPDFTWRSFEVLACSSAEADAHAQARRGSSQSPSDPDPYVLAPRMPHPETKQGVSSQGAGLTAGNDAEDRAPA